MTMNRANFTDSSNELMNTSVGQLLSSMIRAGYFVLQWGHGGVAVESEEALQLCL